MVMINKECRYTMESANTVHHAPDHNHHTQQYWYLASKGITVHSNASSKPRIWYLVSTGEQCVAMLVASTLGCLELYNCFMYVLL